MYVVQTSYDYTLFGVFISFFREMIGDLGEFDIISTEVDSMGVLYIFFFIATILLTIAMLNLLIAIISDTFSRVKNAEDLTKVWERWNIITEIDDILHTKNRGKPITDPQDKKFLMFIYNDCHFKKETSELEFKQSMQNFQKDTKKELNGLEDSVEEFKSITLTKFQKLEEFCAELKNTTESKLKKMEETMELNLEKILKAIAISKKSNKME